MKNYLLFLICLLFVFSQERIIAIGHSYADIVNRLGKSKELVGISIAAKSIKELKHIDDIGLSRNLSLETLLSKKPTIIILNEDAGPKHVIEKLEAFPGLTVLNLKNITNYEMLYSQITEIANVLKVSETAFSLINSLKATQIEIEEMLTSLSKKRNALFIYARGSSLLFVAGKNTQADFVMSQSGLKNVIKQFDGFKALTTEAIIQSNPDYIVMLNSGLKSLANAEQLYNLPGLKMSNAAKNRQLILVDDQAFLAIGPQTFEEMKRIYREVYSHSN